MKDKHEESLKVGDVVLFSLDLFGAPGELQEGTITDIAIGARGSYAKIRTPRLVSISLYGEYIAKKI